MPEESPIELSDILSSRGRIKILELLSRTMELNISEIARRVGLNYSTTNRHLEKLEGAGILTQKRFSRIRIYSFCENSSHALAIKELVESWRSIDSHHAPM